MTTPPSRETKERLIVSNVRYPWRCYRDDLGVWLMHARTGEERAGYLNAEGEFMEGDPDDA